MLKAPFPYFGGKSRAAYLIWPRFGDIPNYVEPFFGSGAVLLARPTPPMTETINDRDAMIANFWRSLQNDPEALADFADAPVNEADLHAKHMWLAAQTNFQERMLTDPDFYDAKIAGWWVWGRCAWIAGGWCDFANISAKTGRMGRSIPNMNFQGVHSERVQSQGVQQHMFELAARLRRVRVVCGDWSRMVTPAVCTGLTAILLDPPYFDGLSDGLYAHSDGNVSADVRRWAIENGSNPNYRICLCGYEGEHAMPDDWEVVEWKATGGYGCQRKDGSNQNQERERLWFSPACLKVTDTLFADYDEDE
jgi:DNA adenine methylase